MLVIRYTLSPPHLQASIFSFFNQLKAAAQLQRVDRQLAGARNNFFAAYGLAVGMGWVDRK